MNRELLRACRGLLLTLAVLLLLGAAAIEVAVRELARIERQGIEHALVTRAADVRSSLETRLNQSIYLSRGLVSYLQSQHGLDDPRRIRLWMASMLTGTSDVRNIGVAPDNRIELIYPLQGNEAALGFDYTSSPPQWAAVERMMASAQPVLDGPLTLLQGGNGLIYREPVYINRRYWGLVSTVMDADRLLGMLDSEQRWQDLRIRLLRVQAGGEPRVIWGTPPVPERPAAVLDIELPGVVWQLQVQYRTPQAGSGAPRGVLYGALLVVLSLIGYTRTNAIRQQRDRDAARAENERLKSEFVSTISHELRTPLTSIFGTLGLLRGGALGPLPDRGQHLVEVAMRNAEHLLRLINDLLDIDKLVAGQMQLNVQPENLDTLLHAAMQENQGYAEQRQVRWRYLNPHPQARIMADPTRFKQVMDNLLSNAVKFSPQGGDVGISVVADEQQDLWCISVTDQGEGIPTAFYDRVFDRFTQADGSSRRRSGGTGLGLAITRGLVEQMGGQIGFVSSDQGTRFFVNMPRLAE